MKTLRPYQQDAVNAIKKKLKESSDPVLVDASVGAGKSLIIAEILLMIERSGFRALCLTLNSTLIQQNADTYNLQGGNAGIYCSGLKSRECNKSVIFASPHSACQGIKNKGDISRQPFNLIVIDEVHNLNPHDARSMYMRIIQYYELMSLNLQYSFRIIGLTGTPYRGKNESIIGENQFFKEKCVQIDMPWLIDNGYLTRPQFGLHNVESIDTSNLRVDNMGKFKHKDLEKMVDENIRLTGKIMHEVVDVMQNHTGAFIFASTKRHCEECAKSLPEGQWAIITGDTPHKERRRLIKLAHDNVIRYLISVNCLNTGVDISSFDVCVWVRLTESLIIYKQGNGRIMRLHENKKFALILDYAGNLERHGNIDDPLINEALKPKEENEHEFIIPCYQCNTLNTIHNRRCIGVINDLRCTHYFQFKDCEQCQTPNDITARECRQCKSELVDPNAKLKRDPHLYELEVKEAKYWITRDKYLIIHAIYKTQRPQVYESYHLASERAKNVAYAKFIRHHSHKASSYYLHMHDIDKLNNMISDEQFKTPAKIICSRDEDGCYKVVKKVF